MTSTVAQPSRYVEGRRGQRLDDSPRTLTGYFVKTLSQPGRYSDGRGSFGLSLRVSEMSSGRLSKTWSQRVRINGKPTNIGLGVYPLVSLAEAREAAKQNAIAIAHGLDPRVPIATVPTFREAVNEVIAVHREGWTSPKVEKQWVSTMEAYAMPVIGNKSVADVSTADVLKILTDIWLTKGPTAKDVRSRISAVMRWAVAQEYRADDPAGPAILKALPKQNQRIEHHKALPFAQLGKALQEVRNMSGWTGAKLAIEFLALTATRSGEARHATWSEVDMETATWTIPAARMKMGLEHRVPLSPAALDVLERARPLSNGTGLIFPAKMGKKSKAMGDDPLNRLLRDHNIGFTPNGLRSSFRDWAAECSDVPREIAEYALAHVEGSAAELAYRRTDYFEKRRGLMNDWADYLSIGP